MKYLLPIVLIVTGLLMAGGLRVQHLATKHLQDVTVASAASNPSIKSYPKGYIPFWSDQKGGYETRLINTNQIVSITPVYDDKTKRNPESVSLTIEFSSGKIIEVDEDFEDFYARIRAAQ